ncbi:MAG: TSUP family transporter [Atopobiaceae bacterium]|nr:TSUP family transporter [Atopobiaceae bacterium]
METLLLILASALAGIGTGLAGLSAATVMVPVLITLCPSFAGETGAYQATAIALASDILGSAVTTWTYWRHSNIDLKRGWIMLACIVCMCTVGSYAAWLAGNVVLGAFTLFLTFFIGIRFLVKPDTTREDAAAHGEKLDAKGIAISLFFGLTIGFGTGFVGTGGGMMMLVVFTVFLHMDLKSAVGTSTFIMTFTALIASVSHILIHPAIVTERAEALVICAITATVFSLGSARFANRVENRTVGLVTGAVLTVLGGAMLILHYWDVLAAIPLARDTILCSLRFLALIIPWAVVLIALYFLARIPKPIFRKLLHMIAFGSSAFLVAEAASWQAAALTMVLFAIAVYPILAVAEKDVPRYGDVFVQKKPGEVKRSLMLLFIGEAAVVAIGWGLAGERAIAAAAILMWGIGDAAAALVGIYFGKHVVRWRIADGKKTWEGTCAMFIAALVCGMFVFVALKSMHPLRTLIAIAPTAAVSALVELASKGGNDTVWVPLATVAMLSAFALLFA